MPPLTRFEGFCQRMWLDHCDENNTILSERLTYKEYRKKYLTYLHERWIKDGV